VSFCQEPYATDLAQTSDRLCLSWAAGNSHLFLDLASLGGGGNWITLDAHRGAGKRFDYRTPAEAN